ncbi:MAG: glycosyltransferase [Thermoproteota archaeon]
MARLRIAVIPYTNTGGLSTYALELSHALAERGLDITLLGVEGVIATRINPLTDIIIDGISGFLFEKGNVAQFLPLMLLLIQDPEIRRKTSEEAQRRILKKFSWNSIAQRIEKYYKEILDTS